MSLDWIADREIRQDVDAGLVVQRLADNRLSFAEVLVKDDGRGSKRKWVKQPSSYSKASSYKYA